MKIGKVSFPPSYRPHALCGLSLFEGDPQIMTSDARIAANRANDGNLWIGLLRRYKIETIQSRFYLAYVLDSADILTKDVNLLLEEFLGSLEN